MAHIQFEHVYKRFNKVDEPLSLKTTTLWTKSSTQDLTRDNCDTAITSLFLQ